jgi:HAD superfamily hydrolase (TIGR01509 family)
LRAVLFDMDGTLVDSEVLWLETEAEVMGRLGGPWGPEYQKDLVGGSLRRTVTYMLSLTGPVAPPAEVGRMLLDGMAERLRLNVPLLPGAKELLGEIHRAGVPAALVSSTHRELMDIALAGIGADLFAVTVAGDEVTATKPDPEPYLTGARLLGTEPRHSVAVEDSAAGVRSAAAAGCAVLAVPSLVEVPAVPRQRVIGSLRDVTLADLRALVAD